MAASGTTLAVMFADACREHAARTAVATASESMTYAALDGRAQRFAAALAAAGLARGERVALWLPNGLDWVVAHWGITLAGGVVVPLGTRNRAPELRHLLDQSQPAALVMIDRFLNLDFLAMVGPGPAAPTVVVRRSGDAELPARVREWNAFVAAGDAVGEAAVQARAIAVMPDDVHAIQFTAGTTGEPRGAMLTHAGLLRVAGSHALSWKLRPGEAIYVPNPLSHIMGMVMAVIMPVLAGATLVTTPTFAAAEALALIERHRCVAMAGTPTHYLALANAPGLTGYDTTSLRLGMCGGAALTAEAVRTITARLQLAGLLNGLGMTEAGGSVTRTALDDPPDVAATTIGRPMAWLETRIVDPLTGVAVAADTPGELWIRGPGVMKGYFRAPEATAQVLDDDGWLRTGDLVRVRADGNLELCGRHKEMFTVGGFNVFPAEVERILAQHPAVAESCVVGVPDQRLGEVPFAFVRWRPGTPASAEDLVAFCRERLAGYKVPRYLAVLADMPTLGAGKIDRRALRARAAREAAELASYLFRS